jgi:hypothetical protein
MVGALGRLDATPFSGRAMDEFVRRSLTGHPVAAAWLLCICVAALALAVTSGLHDKELPAATVADKTAIGWHARSVCRLPLACAEDDTAIGKPW